MAERIKREENQETGRCTFFLGEVQPDPADMGTTYKLSRTCRCLPLRLASRESRMRASGLISGSTRVYLPAKVKKRI